MATSAEDLSDSSTEQTGKYARSNKNQRYTQYNTNQEDVRFKTNPSSKNEREWAEEAGRGRYQLRMKKH